MYEKSIALFSPLYGGGTDRHALEMAHAWSRSNVNVIYMKAFNNLLAVKVLCDGTMINNYLIPLEKDAITLQRLLVAYNTILFHAHHLLNADKSFLHLHTRLHIPLAVTLHDYYMLCPFIKLTNEQEVYCGELGAEHCNACLARRPYVCKTLGKVTDIAQWREFWHEYLRQAALIVVPNEDVKDRFLKYFADLTIQVVENPEVVFNNAAIGQSAAAAISNNNPIRIGVIGILSKAKGAEVVLNCAYDAARRRLPLQFVLFGDFANKPGSPLPATMKILGRYQEREIYDLILPNEINFFWFPAVCPETYSYTLTIPIRLHIPVFGAGLGAIGQRITRHGWGETYSWNLAAECINNRLMKFEFAKYAGYAERFTVTNTEFPAITDYYGDLIKNDRVNAKIDLSSLPALEATIRYATEHNTLKRINGYELKLLLAYLNSWQAKVKLLVRLDWLWFINYFNKYSFRHIFKRALQNEK